MARRLRPSPALIIALVALFVSIGGVGYAASKIGTNDIKNQAVTKPKIAKKAVTTGRLADQAVTERTIRDQAVTTDKIADLAVSNPKLADSSVDSAKIADDSVGASELQTGAVGSNELGANAVRASELGDGVVGRLGTAVTVNGGAAQNGAYVVGTATASCNPGEELIGGMAQWNPDDNASLDSELWIAETRPDFASESVAIDGGNDSGVNYDLRAIAVCLQT